MKATVYLTNISAKDLQKGKEEFMKKYPGDRPGTIEFIATKTDIDYLGGGDIYIALKNYLDVKERKEIYVGVEVNIEELLEDDAFWDAIKDYVEEVEQEQKRYKFMKKLLEAREEMK